MRLNKRLEGWKEREPGIRWSGFESAPKTHLLGGDMSVKELNSAQLQHGDNVCLLKFLKGLSKLTLAKPLIC